MEVNHERQLKASETFNSAEKTEISASLCLIFRKKCRVIFDMSHIQVTRPETFFISGFKKNKNK